MTTTLVNNPTGLTTGTSLVAADTGVVGSQAFDNLDGTGPIQAQNVNSLQWYLYVGNGSAAINWRWTSFTADPLLSSIFRIRIGAAPSQTEQICWHRGSGSNVCRWDITSSLVPQVKNNSGTAISSFSALSFNTDYYFAMASNVSSTTVAAAIYLGTSQTAAQSLGATSTTTGANNHADWRIGKPAANTWSGGLYTSDHKIVVGSATLLLPPTTTTTPAGWRKLVTYAKV